MLEATQEYAELMKVAKPLSARQARILAFLRSYIGEHGYAPCLQEIGEACAMSSTSVVDYNLRALAKAGKVRLAPAIQRGIVLTDGGPCPHCGKA